MIYTYMYCKVWITSQVFPLFVQEFELVGDDLILERQGNLCLLGGVGAMLGSTISVNS